ncbi:MAG: FtsX-like permease family protein [Sulfurimonas sp.]|nr:FtsX-like permease family protein [Sulfurimonas sp.]
MIILKMALRELTTHKKRSIITFLLSAFSTALLIFVAAISEGTHTQLIQSSVETYPGYIQVRDAKFEDDPSFENLIFNESEVKDKVTKTTGIKAVSSRFETFALYSSDKLTVGGMFCAIEPESEAKVSRLKNALVEGEYLSSSDTNALYIGNELAKRLDLKIGDSVSFISTAADYSFAADNLIVKGIFRTKLYEFDNSSAFVNKAYFDVLMHSSDIATHIIATPEDISKIDTVSETLKQNLSNTLEVRNYKQILEDFIVAMEIDGIFSYITLGIFFIVIFFVIAIFAFLSVYGRVRQIGVLRAIGTTPSQVMGMLLFEALLLGLLSVSVGGVASGYATHYYEKNPIELTSIGDMEMEDYYKQYNMVAETTLPTQFDLASIFTQMFIMLLLNLLTVLYTIAMINRFTPIEAIRYV